jgi:hypothetical protein
MNIEIAAFEKSSRVLHALLLRAHGGPEEEQQLKLALTALLFAVTQHGEAFRRFAEGMGDSLSEEEQEQLRKLGL